MTRVSKPLVGAFLDSVKDRERDFQDGERALRTVHEVGWNKLGPLEIPSRSYFKVQAALATSQRGREETNT